MTLGLMCALCGYINQSKTAWCVHPGCPLMEAKKTAPREVEAPPEKPTEGPLA